MPLSADDRWLLKRKPDELLDMLVGLHPAEADRILARLDELTQRPIVDEPAPVWDVDEPWDEWIEACLPEHFPYPFAPHHEQMWEWEERVTLGRAQEPLIVVLARGGAKSTNAEGMIARLAVRHARRFVLYVCGTQTQANDHVVNVQGMFEAPGFARRYPELANPLLGALGQVKAWRQNRLRTASGFTVHGLGLDAAVRGIKVDMDRPDMIVLDDVDDLDDSPLIAEGKETTIKETIIPSGSSDVIVLGVQNVVHPDSVFARLLDGRAEMLHRRRTLGPIPALRNAAYHERDDGQGWEIVAGEATWVGQSVRACQDRIDLIGVTAFRREAQHEVTAKPGGMFSEISYRYCDEADVPVLDVVTVWVDPAVTAKDGSDSQAIQVDGRADDVIYRLWSFEQITSPLEAVKMAIRAAHRFGATTVGIETDQGGDTWDSVYRDALVELALDEDDPLPLDSLATRRAGVTPHDFVGKAPTKLDAKAGSSIGGPKTERAARMLADYERNASKLVHVVNSDGTHLVLEAALFRFPKTKPLDLADAAYWSWRYLRYGDGRIETAQGRVPTGREALRRGTSTRIPTGTAAALGVRARQLGGR